MDSAIDVLIREESIDEAPMLLTLNDRCDASANGVEAAKVAVWFSEDGEPVLLCGHHYSKHEVAIISSGPFKIHDQRENETENRQQGDYS